MRHRDAFFVGAAIALAPLGAGCSLGQGDGAVHSDLLYAKDCWCSTYDMQPDFFAAVPYRNTVQLRVQRGTDLQEVSDGLAILVDDVQGIRQNHLNKRLAVALPTAVEPLGVAPDGTGMGTLSEGCGPDPSAASSAGKCDLSPLGSGVPDVEGTPLVHMALYLQQSCHNQNTVLYAVSGVVMFKSLFSGDPNESVAADKYTEAIFDVQVGDLQEVPAGKEPNEIPEDKLTNLKGCFKFYFERGQPGQPFP